MSATPQGNFGNGGGGGGGSKKAVHVKVSKKMVMTLSHFMFRILSSIVAYDLMTVALRHEDVPGGHRSRGEFFKSESGNQIKAGLRQYLHDFRKCVGDQ